MITIINKTPSVLRNILLPNTSVSILNKESCKATQQHDASSLHSTSLLNSSCSKDTSPSRRLKSERPMKFMYSLAHLPLFTNIVKAEENKTSGFVDEEDDFEFVFPKLPLHKKLLVFADSVLRFSRTFITGAIIIADYKWTWWRVPESDPNYEQVTSQLHKRSAERVLRLCKKNGGVYIKGGQHIASLNQVLPREWTHTLAVLQDKAEGVPYSEVRDMFVEEFGAPPEVFFSHFEEFPFAAASLGTEVAVKVQYPKVRSRFRGDMFAYAFSVKAVEKAFTNYSLSWVTEEVRQNLLKELDFEHEARNAARAKKDLEDMGDRLYIPYTIPTLTSKRILTMEFIHGFKITDLEKLKKFDIDIPTVTTTMIEAFARQIFVTGFVHCDPHPGNILVRKTLTGRDQVVLLDHGLYKRLRNEFREHFSEIWTALVMQDEEKLKLHSLKLGVKDYEMLGVMILMRPYKGAGIGIPENLSKEDLQKFMEEARARAPEMISMMQSLPKELVLLTRNISVNKEMGDPVNRFVIMARVASSAVQVEAVGKGWLNRFKSGIQTLRDSIWFEWNLLWYAVTEWLFKTARRLRLLPGAEILDMIEKEMDDPSLKY